ncbi:uncharacterized protein BDCG_17681 [Blastomyces dermatitidis ER-3]|uniref:Uncharacterized protein n=1 Tax=Ajellomyces dermatitidis (strain ER-3 / ATCC MYA-2586) TaxID=559297 RepID=A0ABX2VZR1_AJEDR|nr:uncharacterized protein BDCG_17681 [Blastomyces dermatitidis ER-3]OAT02619.1 hypothetical protein BDCG_17681 [Blastomyces dermatitidis ER-3]
MKREREKKSVTNIEKTALFSEHVNLLAAKVKPETADQEMRDFEIQVDLAEEKQQKPFSEKAVKRDFEMIIISDKKKEKKKKKKKKKNEK